MQQLPAGNPVGFWTLILLAPILDEKARLSREDRAFIYFSFQGVCKSSRDIGFLRQLNLGDLVSTF
jgi:hypothetical protein